MQAPICGVCLRSGMLCQTCRKKVKTGVVSDTDVHVSRVLLRLSANIKSLRDITLKHAVESGSLMVIICEQGDAARVIGRNGLVVKKLEKELGKPVRIVEEASDIKEFILNLLHPVPVAGVNVLYRPQGEVLKVLVGRGPGPRIPAGDFRRIMKTLFGKDVEVVSA